MTVPHRNTEQLAAIHRTLPPHVVAKLPRDHQGPPLDLFECGKEHARRDPGPHREPPLPFLTRYDIHDEKAELVDSFFHWYSRFPSEPHPRCAEDHKNGSCLIEVIPHGSYLREPPRDPKPKQGWGSRGNSSAAFPVNQELRREDEYPMYFIEDPRCHVCFERLAYGRGRYSRAQKLDFLHCTLLKCKEHGSSWEVNVLGQKVTINRASKLEVESGDEIESDSADQREEMKKTIHKMQKRLRKLEVRIEKSEEKDAKDHEAKEAAFAEKVDG